MTLMLPDHAAGAPGLTGRARLFALRSGPLWWSSGEEEGLRSPSPDPAAPRSAGAGRAGRSLRILIVEDNRDFADGLKIVFEIYGHQATVTYTGTEGVEAALRELPDVVVCDIGLPGMDGFEVARTLRANESTAAIFIVAVTGYGNPADRQSALAAGFDAHLVKPVEIGEILALIEKGRRSTPGS